MNAEPTDNRNQEPGTALVRALKGPELTSVAKDLAEVSLDAFIAPGFLRDVPVLGLLLGAREGFLAVRDAIFTKKLFNLLSPLSDLTTGERYFLAESISASSKGERYAGEQLIALADRLDSFAKARLAGRALVAHARGHFDSLLLQRILHSLDKVLLADLDQLPAYLQEKRTDPHVLYGLANAGLVRIPDGLLTSRYYPDEPLCNAIVNHLLN